VKKGWQAKNLGDLCNVVGGGTPPKDNPAFYSGEIPWATVRDMRQDVITETEFRITKDAVKSSATNIIPSGNVVIATRVGLGKVCLIGQDTAINQDLRGIVPRNDKTLVVRYLYWWLKSIADVIVAEGTGATVQGVKLPFVKSLQIPVPPLPEQQRIVGILDEAFEGIATAKANAEKNLQNARAIFESHLNDVFTRRGKGWVDRTLDQVCIVERGSSPRPIKEYFTTESDGVNWIKIGDTEEGGKYVYTTAQKITPEGAKQSRFVKEGDFILTNSMSYGRPYIMKTSGYIHDGWFVLRLNMAIDTDYFYYLLSSPVVQSQFASLASGSVVKNISGDLVKKAVLPIPPLEHQHIIVEKLLTMSEETQRLESIYQQKLAALEALKKSLLNQAFIGEL
jgi:type I restriction enzyme S subunit